MGIAHLIFIFAGELFEDYQAVVRLFAFQVK
jgi:hypothetical protein